jgi:hypothetical protein
MISGRIFGHYISIKSPLQKQSENFNFWMISTKNDHNARANSRS